MYVTLAGPVLLALAISFVGSCLLSLTVLVRSDGDVARFTLAATVILAAVILVGLLHMFVMWMAHPILSCKKRWHW